MIGRDAVLWSAFFAAVVASVNCSGGSDGSGSGAPSGAAGVSGATNSGSAAGASGTASSGIGSGSTGTSTAGSSGIAPSSGAPGGSGSAASGLGASGAASGSAASGNVDAGSAGALSDASSRDGAPISTDAAATPVAPVMRNGHFAFDVGDLTFEVDPNVGGRIVTFSVGGVNLLTGPAVNPIYWGSTLWTSPESQWSQPPPTQIDSDPYTVTSTAPSLVMTSPAPSTTAGSNSMKLGVVITKTFSADSTGAVAVQYKITNQKQTAIQMAAWEVTRVPASGLTFYPTGSKMSLSPGATLPTTNTGGVTWFAYDSTKITANSKLYADGLEGWLAHADQGLVLIKKFAYVPVSQQAPNEANVELFTNQVHTYIELEDQGAYTMLAPQASITWTVTWYLKRVPASVSVAAGSAALAQFVRNTIQ